MKTLLLTLGGYVLVFALAALVAWRNAGAAYGHGGEVVEVVPNTRGGWSIVDGDGEERR